MPSPYRQFFTAQEIEMLDATPPDDLSSEINLIRVLIVRVLEAAQQVKDMALQQRAALLAAFAHAGITLSALVRHQVRFHPNEGILSEIEEGEHLARLHLGVYDYLSFGGAP
jgi:hypothetical protein